MLDLSPTLQRRVNRGEIPVMNAYELARLPQRLHSQFEDRAVLMSCSEFQQEVANEVRKLSIAFGTNRSSPPKEFTPHPYLRRLKDVLRDSQIVMNQQEQTSEEFEDGWKAAIEWVTNMDAQTLDQRRREYSDRIQSRIERKKA